MRCINSREEFVDTPTAKFGEALRAQVEERLNFFETGAPPSKNMDAIRKVLDDLALEDEPMDEDEEPALTTLEVTPKKEKKKRKRDMDVDGDEEDVSTKKVKLSKEEKKALKRAKKEAKEMKMKEREEEEDGEDEEDEEKERKEKRKKEKKKGSKAVIPEEQEEQVKKVAVSLFPESYSFTSKMTMPFKVEHTVKKTKEKKEKKKSKH
jgi:hypothetical protein